MALVVPDDLTDEEDIRWLGGVPVPAPTFVQPADGPPPHWPVEPDPGNEFVRAPQAKVRLAANGDFDLSGLKPLDTTGLKPAAPSLDVSGLKPLDVSGLKSVGRVTENPVFTAPDEPSKTLAPSLSEYGVTDEDPTAANLWKLPPGSWIKGVHDLVGYYADVYAGRKQVPTTYDPDVADPAADEAIRQSAAAALNTIGTAAKFRPHPNTYVRDVTPEEFLRRAEEGAGNSPIVAEFQSEVLKRSGYAADVVARMSPADRQAAFKAVIAEGGFGNAGSQPSGPPRALPAPEAAAQPAAAARPTAEPAAAPEAGPVDLKVNIPERDGLLGYGYTDAQIEAMSPAQRAAEYENAVAAGAVSQPAPVAPPSATPAAAPAAPPVSAPVAAPDVGVVAPVAQPPAGATAPVDLSPIEIANALHDAGWPLSLQVPELNQRVRTAMEQGLTLPQAAASVLQQATTGEPTPPPVMPSGHQSLAEMLADPRSAKEIRADMEAAKAWQPSEDWQSVPRGAALDPTLEVRALADGGQEARIAPEPGSRAAPVHLDAPQDVTLGAERTATPTPAQAEAGNYAKRHLTWNGLDITVETEAGQARTGVGPDGVPWSVTLQSPYGYIKGTKGRDGDHLDLYVGPHPESPTAYVFDQVDPDTRKADEHKLVIGAQSLDQAKEIYEAGFSDGSGPMRWGAVTEMSVRELKGWLANGDTEKPLAYTPPKPVAVPKEPTPLSLMQFLASKGGIRDDGGELRHMGLERKFIPGYGRLVRSSGRYLDNARELAAEAGYPVGAHSFGTADERVAGSTVNDLLDLLREESHGNRVHSDEDRATLRRREDAAAAKVDKARAKEVEADVREIAERLKIARLTDEEVQSVVGQVMVHNAHPEDALADVIERSAYAADDDLVASDTREGLYERSAENVATGTDQARAEPAQARELPARAEAEPATGSPARGEQSGGIEHPAPKTESVAPPARAPVAPSAFKPAPTPEELEIPSFLRRLKDEPKAAEPEPAPEPARAETPTARTPESEIRAEADKRWRRWMSSRENRADGARRPRLATFIKRVRMERRAVEKEAARAAKIEETAKAKEAAKQARKEERAAARAKPQPQENLATAKSQAAPAPEANFHDQLVATQFTNNRAASGPDGRGWRVKKEGAGYLVMQMPNEKGVPPHYFRSEKAPWSLDQAVAEAERRAKPQPSAERFSLREPEKPTAPAFYSAVAKAVENVKLNKAPPAQWMNTIRNAPGVKPEELEWLGLNDWLKEQKGPVTRDAIADYVRANQIEVKEVEKGDPPASRALFATNAKLIDKYGGLDEAFKRWTPAEEAEWERLNDRAVMVDGADMPSAREPKYSEYQLPGGENYRELLLTLPPGKGERRAFSVREPENPNGTVAQQEWRIVDAGGRWIESRRTRADAEARAAEISDLTAKHSDHDFRSGHWDEPNVLAHVRFNDRTIDGKRTLFLEEVQSDWHQAGKRKGYKEDDAVAREAAAREMDRADTELRFAEQKHRLGRGYVSDASLTDDIRQHFAPEAIAEVRQALDRFRAAREAYAQYDMGSGRVPDAPFKTTWPELSMKRMIRYAAENGYDKIAWTPGSVQAERYDLSKHVDRLGYTKRADGKYDLTAEKGGNPVLSEDGITVDRIAEIVGKDIADKIQRGEGKVYDRYNGNETAELTGIDLKVGGEGMKGFYDQILPATVNKLVKKFGGRVEQGTVKADNAPEHIVDEWAARDPDHPFVKKNRTPVHTLDITPALREAALGEGFPLFKRRSAENANSPTAANDIATTLRAELDRMGLKDVALELPKKIERYLDGSLAKADASYLDGVIRVALDTENKAHALNHEIMHTIRDMGLFTDGEWGILSRAADKWRAQHNIDERYSGFSEDVKTEEAIAHAYADWQEGKSAGDGRIARLFRRIREFFEALGNALRGKGFKSAEDVFRSIKEGEVGARPRNEDIPKGTPRFADRDLFKTEPGADGRPQTVIPEAEKISDRQLAERKAAEPLKPTKEQKTVGDLPLFSDKPAQGEMFALRHGPIAEKVGALRAVAEKAMELADEAQMKVAPMAVGSMEAQAAAKDYANAVRQARHQWSRRDDLIKQNFTPEQRARMWEAADKESVALQQGKKPKPGEGKDALTDPERKLTESLQDEANRTWAAAQDVGIVEGEGLPSYVPRMMVLMNEAGGFDRPPRGDGYSGNPEGIGRQFRTTTGQTKQRKHMTAEETETAMKARFGPNAKIAKDIRALALGTAKLQEATAARALVNKIKSIGNMAGEVTVSEGAEPAEGRWFTLDHPAFKTYRPVLKKSDTTGKWENAKYEDGTPAFERVPIYIRSDFKGPLLAVLGKDNGKIYNGLMALKGKAMSMVMYSPVIHNMVEYSRALPAYPLKVASTFIYFEGNRAKHDPTQMREAINAGLVPIGKRFFNQDITSVMEEPTLAPGQRSWTAQVLGFVPGLFDRGAGDAVKRAVDKAGDFWHNKLLWDRVADLQMGLYVNMRRDLIAKGHDAQTASRVAAHFANRYAGALPIEAMSSGARKLANMVLFSRTFTFGNLGAMKDMLTGLPRDVQAQIMRDAGPEALGKIKTFAKRKSMAILMLDIALGIITTSLMQDAFKKLRGEKDWFGENGLFADYYRRFIDLIEHTKDHPADTALHPINSLWKLSSTATNEPHKREGMEARVLLYYDQRGRAVYGRNPMGKIGEEFTGWPTAPGDMILRKLGTFTRPALQVMMNDKYAGAGFDRPTPIWRPNPEGAEWFKNAGRIAKTFAEAQLPADALRSAGDLMDDESKKDPLTSKLKILAPFAGVSVSQGHPGGMRGAIADEKRRGKALDKALSR